MKKNLAIMLMVIMATFLVACSSGKETDKDTNSTGSDGNNNSTEAVAKDSLEILTNVWGAYEDSEKFAIIGGDMENSVSDAPGKFDISNAENLDATLGLPQDSASLIDDCASIMHMMNANTFTGAVYHVKDAKNAEKLAADLKDNILARQWMCGFPDKLVVALVGEDYVVSAFGNGEAIDNFKSKLAAQYSGTKVLFEENITE